MKAKKPIYETDNIRAFQVTDKKLAKELAESSKGAIEIKMGKATVKLMGFTQIVDKKELKLAYKLQPENKSFLYYVPESLSTDDFNKVTDLLSHMAVKLSMQPVNVSNHFKDIKEAIQ